MKRALLVCVVLLFALRAGLAEMPAGFSWVDIEWDKDTVAKVRHALHDPSITAIREVGVKDGFALVMTASREHDAPTPDYDRWTIYNISLKTENSRVLVKGYGVKLLDWIGGEPSELAISYYDCWECESGILFTTLRFKPGIGWRARWPNDAQDSENVLPGAVVQMSEMNEEGEPREEYVFAVVSESKDGYAAGSWLHSVDTKTGKAEDTVERYSVDPVTKEDRVEQLTGAAALNWEREICNSSRILMQPSSGQDSKACRSVLRSAIAGKKAASDSK